MIIEISNNYLIDIIHMAGDIDMGDQMLENQLMNREIKCKEWFVKPCIWVLGYKRIKKLYP